MPVPVSDQAQVGVATSKSNFCCALFFYPVPLKIQTGVELLLKVCKRTYQTERFSATVKRTNGIIKTPDKLQTQLEEM